jgi:hypothetical protein
MWWYQDASRYTERLRAFQGRFRRVLVLCFERFTADTLASMREVESFLGLEPFDGYELDRIYARSGRPRGALSGWLLDRRNPVAYRLRELAKRYVPRRAAEAVAGRLVREAPQDDDLLRFQEELWSAVSEDARLEGCGLPFEPEAYWGPGRWRTDPPGGSEGVTPIVGAATPGSPVCSAAQKGGG